MPGQPTRKPSDEEFRTDPELGEADIEDEDDDEEMDDEDDEDDDEA
jgi:hypothetical protein